MEGRKHDGHRDALETGFLDLGDDSLFGNEAGEEEDPEILSSYFLSQGEFSRFLSHQNRIAFARARKGMGKSALLSKLAYDLSLLTSGPLVVKATGADLTALGEFSSADPAVLVNQWQQVICARITQSIGAHIHIALSDRAMLMVEAAEIAGLKDRNILRALVDRLSLKLSAAGKGVEGEVSVQRLRAPDSAALLSRYQQSADEDVWLLIDDVDATFINRPDQQLKVGTFFSACRKIAREVKGLKVRATVRSDVWSVIRENEDLDKCEQYMVDIKWTKQEMGVMLAKRIHAFLERNKSSIASDFEPHRDTDRLVELAFKPRIRWGSSRVPPIQALNIFSAKRPRWMAQLCGRAGKKAAAQGDVLISGEHITAVLKKFGELRLADLKKEHGHQFGGLSSLIEAFAGGSRTYSTADLLARIQAKYLKLVAKNGVPRLEGVIIKAPLQLAYFLFKIGFVQGKHQEADQFVDYDERPDLLQNEVNLDDGLEWAVYPSYRSVLRIR